MAEHLAGLVDFRIKWLVDLGSDKGTAHQKERESLNE